MLAKCGLEHQLESCKKEQGFSFDLTNQVTLYIGTVGASIVGDCHRDAATTNTDYSDTTLATSKAFLKTPIIYLLVLSSKSSVPSGEDNQQVPPSSPSVSHSVQALIPLPSTPQPGNKID